MKLTRGMVVCCPNGHECGRVVGDVEEGAPITGEHLAIEPVFAPRDAQAYVCPACREVVARVSGGGDYQVYVTGRRWVS